MKKTWIMENMWKRESELGGHCIWGLSHGFPGGAVDIEPACRYRRHKGWGLSPCVWKIPWRGKCQSTPAFFPRKTHGQRSLQDHSPQGWTQLSTWARTMETRDTSTWGGKIGWHDFPMACSDSIYTEVLERWEGGWTKFKFNLWLVKQRFKKNQQGRE